MHRYRFVAYHPDRGIFLRWLGPFAIWSNDQAPVAVAVTTATASEVQELSRYLGVECEAREVRASRGIFASIDDCKAVGLPDWSLEYHHQHHHCRHEYVCLFCGCTDSVACETADGTCHWLFQHATTQTGLCSDCSQHRDSWHQITRSWDALVDSVPLPEGHWRPMSGQ